MILIDIDNVTNTIEEKQKELCPVGRYSRNYLTGLDREKYDEWEDLIDAVRSIPTVDAVPVVRCGECKHRGTDDCPMHIKGVPADEGFLKVVDNAFCSYGERRSE